MNPKLVNPFYNSKTKLIKCNLLLLYYIKSLIKNIIKFIKIIL